MGEGVLDRQDACPTLNGLTMIFGQLFIIYILDLWYNILERNLIDKCIQ